MVYYNIVCWFIHIGVQKTHEFRIRNLFPFSHDWFAGSPGDNPTATCGMYSSGDAEATRGKVQLVDHVWFHGPKMGKNQRWAFHLKKWENGDYKPTCF